MKLAQLASCFVARIFVVLSVMALLVTAGATSKAQAQTNSGFTYNGMAYTSYWFNEYQQTPQGPDGTAAMAAAGVNYATVLVTQYVQTATSNTIAASGTQTPTDAAVVAAIKNLQAQGIKVALKPHIDSQDGAWRGQLAPTDVAAWFAAYQTFIVHYATIAQAQNADVFVIGCELKTLSGSYNGSSTRPYWLTIINAIRAVYTGPITYAANASGAGDEFTSVSFWDQLDMIGVDGYFPLTNQADPTLTQLKNAWTTASANKNGFAPLTALKNLQASVINAQSGTTMPLIFTELGYMSTSGTNIEPYNYSHPGTYDPTEQQNCYEAFFEVFSQQTSWMKGVFWWDWTVSPPATNDKGYSPQNKPAGDVTLPLWYGPATSSSFTLAASALTQSITQGKNGTNTITVTGAGGFTGGVTLAATGLPVGVSAAFATNPATVSSVLTLTASATATVGGPVTVTITGTSGTLTASTTIALTVNAAVTPSFTLSAAPSSLAVTQGGNNTDTITVTNVGGFTGVVTLATTGLPTGVTAGFAAGIASGAQVLTLTASNTATVGGPVTVTIAGTSGTLTSSTTIALTVNAPPVPAFAVSALPASLTVTAGSGGTSAITVTPSGGFIGSVALTAVVTGPAGAANPPTASFGSTSPVSITSATAGTATLTFSTTGSSSTCTVASTHRSLPWSTVGGAALAFVLLFGIPARRRKWTKMLGLLALFIALAGGMAACGGGGGGKACTVLTTPGTTPGAYTVSITATSGAITPAPTTVTLHVQ